MLAAYRPGLTVGRRPAGAPRARGGGPCENGRMDQAFSPRVDAALALAARAHRTQVRKGTDVPYIVHPVQVGILLLRHGFDEDLVVAGILHDTIEDTDLELGTIRAMFGDGVAARIMLDVRVNGPGAGRESAIRALAAAGIDIRSIRDATPIPHNGCRPRKRRRV